MHLSCFESFGSHEATILRVRLPGLYQDILSVRPEAQESSFLVQNHNAYDKYSVIDTVIMGDKELYDIKTEREEIYMKADFTNEDGIRAGILEDLFLKKNGWQAESDAAIL